jgi:hypothetical protein
MEERYQPILHLTNCEVTVAITTTYLMIALLLIAWLGFQGLKTCCSSSLVRRPSNKPVFSHFAANLAASDCMFFQPEAADSSKSCTCDIFISEFINLFFDTS